MRLHPKLVHHVGISAHVTVLLMARQAVGGGVVSGIIVGHVAYVLAHLDLDLAAALPRGDVVVPAELIQVVLLGGL